MVSLRCLNARLKYVKIGHIPKTFNAFIGDFKYLTCRLSDRHSGSFGGCKTHRAFVVQAPVSWHVSPPGAQQCYTWAKTEARNLGNALKCWLTKGSCWGKLFLTYLVLWSSRLLLEICHISPHHTHRYYGLFLIHLISVYDLKERR